MKQIGGLLYPLVKTIDDLVFYELCGEYYARKKSTLSSKRVKTSPEFRRTMVHANLLARASKIGATVYKPCLPAGVNSGCTVLSRVKHFLAQEDKAIPALLVRRPWNNDARLQASHSCASQSKP